MQYARISILIVADDPEHESGVTEETYNRINALAQDMGEVYDVSVERGLVLEDEPPERCAKHPAYEPDYCPLCGTARVIGGQP